MKMPGRCDGPKFLSDSLGKWRRRHLGGHDLDQKNGQTGGGFNMVQKVFGIREAKNGNQS